MEQSSLEPIRTTQVSPNTEQHQVASQLSTGGIPSQVPGITATPQQAAVTEKETNVPTNTGSPSPYQEQPSMAAKSSAGAPITVASEDSTLEYNSMVLMSKLEQYVIKLSDKSAQASLTLALDHLIEMTNYIVEFSEKFSTTGQILPLDKLLLRDEKNYFFLKTQYVKDKHIIRYEDFYLKKDSINQKDIFEKMSADLLRVINIYLSINVKAFNTPRMADQWKTLYKGFYKHLLSAIRQIQSSHNN